MPASLSTPIQLRAFYACYRENSIDCLGTQEVQKEANDVRQAMVNESTTLGSFTLTNWGAVLQCREFDITGGPKADVLVVELVHNSLQA